MFEIAGAEEEISRRALKLAAYKLPIKCKIVSKAELAASLETPAAPETTEAES
jgi:large subunit ribosomal protein L16